MFKLSYVITTFNKLPFLKQVMTRLLENIQQDEEIVVTDGASTDGTVEYLNNLFQQGKIHQFVSERDKGEPHGYNKGFLMARGDLIKVITDDDSFYYPAINDCKNFMLEHNEVDVMIGNTFNTQLEMFDDIKLQKDVEDRYLKWLSDGSCFSFTGLSLMIKKKSLALTGLFSCATLYPDSEFSLRITSIPTIIAWSSAAIVVRIDNPGSNMRNFGVKQNQLETDRLFYYYDANYRKNKNNLRSNVSKAIRSFLEKFIEPISNNRKKINNSIKTNTSIDMDTHSNNLDYISDFYNRCDEYLSKYNSNTNNKILVNKIIY